MLQSVAGCCRVLQGVAECCKVLHCIALCYAVLKSLQCFQNVALCCIVCMQEPVCLYVSVCMHVLDRCITVMLQC